MSPEPRILHPVTFFDQEQNPSGFKDFRATPAPAATFQKDAADTVTFDAEDETPITDPDAEDEEESTSPPKTRSGPAPD